VVLRPDAPDFEGTGVTVQIARQLEVPHLMLLVNQLPPNVQPQAVRARVEQTFKCEVAAILPQSPEFMSFDNNGLFALRHASHPLSRALQHVCTGLMAATATQQVHAA
jgi:MinD-like ATPase involved in chromosome partitioning or flagellar assembly